MLYILTYTICIINIVEKRKERERVMCVVSNNKQILNKIWAALPPPVALDHAHSSYGQEWTRAHQQHNQHPLHRNTHKIHCKSHMKFFNIRTTTSPYSIKHIPTKLTFQRRTNHHNQIHQIILVTRAVKYTTIGCQTHYFLQLKPDDHDVNNPSQTIT